MTIPKKNLAAETRSLNDWADGALATLRSMPKSPKPVVLTAEQRSARRAFHFERISLARRDLTRAQVLELASRCMLAEQNGDPMPELVSAAATAEEWLMKPEAVRMGLNLKAEVGTQAAADLFGRWIARISEDDMPADMQTAPVAPLSGNDLKSLEARMLLNQVGRTNIEKAAAEKAARDSMPAKVDVTGHGGPNLTARICSALRAQGYARLPSDELVTLAGRVRREGRVTGA